MKHAIWKIIIAAALAFTLGTAVQVSAEDEEFEKASGLIVEAYRNNSTIVIKPNDPTEDLITIVGFPFHNLEKQLAEELEVEEVIIDVDDCIKVEYSKNSDGEYKFEILTMFSKTCFDCNMITMDCDCGGKEIYCDEEGMTRIPVKKRKKPKPGKKVKDDLIE